MYKLLDRLFIMFAIFFTALPSLAKNNSWYVVDSYEGYVGNYPVHLSLQSRDSDRRLNLSGSYYYDKRSAPIPLFGMRKNDDIILCEIISTKEYDDFIVRGLDYDMSKCPFTLNKTSGVLKGVWDHKKKNYPVSLRKVSLMNPSSIQGKKDGEIDIPFWGQTTGHSFIGVYEQDNSGLLINRVNVIDKKSGQVIQTIDPQKYRCQFGFYMTDIYRNVESDIDKSRILFNCMSTGRDVNIVYQWNSHKKKYVVVKE